MILLGGGSGVDRSDPSYQVSEVFGSFRSSLFFAHLQVEIFLQHGGAEGIFLCATPWWVGVHPSPPPPSGGWWVMRQGVVTHTRDPRCIFQLLHTLNPSWTPFLSGQFVSASSSVGLPLPRNCILRYIGTQAFADTRV